MERYPFERLAILVVTLLLGLLGLIRSAAAVPIANDPNGFETIPWGSILAEMDSSVQIEDAGHLQTYELIGQAPVFGTVRIDSLRFTAFEKKLGRVTVQYTGQANHAKILSYLESKYGPLDRTPGQIATGPVKVYTWHGTHTDVILRFESGIERGIIFWGWHS